MQYSTPSFSDYHHLTFRQQPERARVVGSKDKGERHAINATRSKSSLAIASKSLKIFYSNSLYLITERKPIDPPPIIQLEVKGDCEASKYGHILI